MKIHEYFQIHDNKYMRPTSLIQKYIIHENSIHGECLLQNKPHQIIPQILNSKSIYLSSSLELGNFFNFSVLNS